MVFLCVEKLTAEKINIEIKGAPINSEEHKAKLHRTF